MSKKKKKEEDRFSNYDMNEWLQKVKNGLSVANSKERLEKIKLVIIRMFGKIKKNPKLLEFESSIAVLLKECNLNLQFIRRNEDCWQLFNTGHIEDALNEIINTMKTVNTHPEKYLIKPEIIGAIVDSVKQISDRVESDVSMVKPEPETIMKLNSEQTIPHLSSQSDDTILKPSIQTKNPFETSKPLTNPFEKIENQGDKIDNTVFPNQNDQFDTQFRPKNPQSTDHTYFSDSNAFESNFKPFPQNNKAEKLSDEDLDSIQTFWKGKDEKSEDPKMNNIPELNPTENPFAKKKKTDNPWPDQ